jgi:hypothetical protein
MRCWDVGWERVQVGLQRKNSTLFFTHWDNAEGPRERQANTPEGGKGLG